MILKLYNVTDSANVIGKAKQEIISMDIFLKRDVDISSPVLILSTDSPDGFAAINYAEMPDLQRFYFVDSIANIGAKLWKLNLRCDVIETYKNDILASKALLRRKIKNGDYIDVSLFNSVNKTTTRYDSNKGLPAGSSIIMSTVGVA